MDTRKDVLVVDDDPDMAEAMLLVLESAGYAARSAPNGRQALEQVAVQLPSLILLDMLMPVMNGWQFAHALHERYGHTVPIVVVSAAEHVGARSEEIDADDVLSKPFDMDELLRVVKRYA
jgi:CheY-like chemotaxis protein